MVTPDCTYAFSLGAEAAYKKDAASASEALTYWKETY